jgi:hypothetical protein
MVLAVGIGDHTDEMEKISHRDKMQISELLSFVLQHLEGEHELNYLINYYYARYREGR